MEEISTAAAAALGVTIHDDDKFARKAERLLAEVDGKQLTASDKIQMAGVYAALSQRYTMARLAPARTKPQYDAPFYPS